MKRLFLLVTNILLVICASCQNRSFENFSGKFRECTLPISTDSIIANYIEKRNIITLTEFNSFIKSQKDLYWQYKQYSDNNTSFFEYYPLCRFKIKGQLIGFLYHRAYWNDDETKNRTDVVLSIYDRKGNQISSLPISGNRFDNFVSTINFDEIQYRATIQFNYEIEILYSTYCWKEEQENTIKKYYHITDSGEIVELK